MLKNLIVVIVVVIVVGAILAQIWIKSVFGPKSRVCRLMRSNCIDNCMFSASFCEHHNANVLRVQKILTLSWANIAKIGSFGV